MVCVNDNRGIFKLLLGGVHIIKRDQILIMIIRVADAVFVDTAAQNGVGKLITCGFYLPSAVQESVTALRRRNGVEHNGIIAACGIFHTAGHVHAACGKAVILIFYASCTHGNIGEQV